MTPDGVREVAGEGTQRRVELPLADATEWMTGRADRPDLPALPRWL
ncbi:hypothetical protein [Pseudonocardia nigra]|nr:hypothetical protein [Pseudonocardia nigra]